jgi:hypothetical protein
MVPRLAKRRHTHTHTHTHAARKIAQAAAHSPGLHAAFTTMAEPVASAA